MRPIRFIMTLLCGWIRVRVQTLIHIRTLSFGPGQDGDFRTLTLDAVRATRPRTSESGFGGRRIALVDMRVVYEGGTIGPVIRALHE